MFCLLHSGWHLILSYNNTYISNASSIPTSAEMKKRVGGGGGGGG